MSDFIPGAILYRTRIGSLKALVSYVWLEILPLAGALSVLGGGLAVRFFVAHIAFLGLYELGYLYNDSVTTSSERSPDERPTSPLRPGTRLAVTLVRVSCFGLYLGWTAVNSGVNAALFGGIAAVVIVVLLFSHTWLGTRLPPGSPVRWVSFGWLAWGKYLPALLTCVSWPQAKTLTLSLFVAYGGGRVLSYAVVKHRGSPGVFAPDFNGCWFLVGAPLVIFQTSLLGDSAGAWVLLTVLGTHHLTMTLARHWTVRRARGGG